MKLVQLSSVTGGINDGVVSVHSARWGRMRGCIPVDHSEQVLPGGLASDEAAGKQQSVEIGVLGQEA